MSITDFSKGDSVVVVRGDTPTDKAVGKTGTVFEVHASVGLIVVRGPGGRIADRVLGPRAFAPNQLQHAA